MGVTLPSENLDEFYRELCSYLDTFPAECFEASVKADAIVDLSELTLENVAKIDLLAPFGQENAVPHYLARGVFLEQAKAVGAEKNHLSARLSDGVNSVAAIMFRAPNITELLRCKCALDAVFRLQIDTWKNYRSVKAMVEHLAPLDASGCPGCDQATTSFLHELSDSYCDTCPSASFEAQEEPSNAFVKSNREQWEMLAKKEPQALRSKLASALIGTATLHEAQAKTLELLDAGESVFSVMGTGRGKSLIFHLFAIELALKQHKQSIFLYPLRALISDQAFHLREVVSRFGITVEVLMGATPQEERERILAGLERGSVDIILTTPEYLACHVDELAKKGSFGFVTIDEAHHVGLAREDFRVAYKHICDCLHALGDPQVLAVTATANDAIAKGLIDLLPLDVYVADEWVRTNLHIDDKRNIRKRDLYLASIVASGEKTIVYVNSRMETIMLTKRLRELVPHLAWRIGFYNAGLTRAERNRIEELFRNDELSVLIATSAFGEGVDLPHIRHVVLYHMPFSEVEFNQMSGRAGRDGEDAFIHLLFGRNDGSINQSILHEMTPTHDNMAQIYRELRRQQKASEERFYAFAFDQLARSVTSLFPTFSVSIDQTRSGVAVFEELGLVETRTEQVNNNTHHFIHVVDYKGKVELIDSVRYREGVDEIASFDRFKDWVLSCSAEELERCVQKPLMPHAEEER